MAYGQAALIAGACALGALLFVAALVAIVLSPAWVTWTIVAGWLVYDATLRRYRRRCP